MTTINHECYVSLEVAKLLKEASFDWKCKLYFSELINVPKEAGVFDARTNKVYGCFDSTIPGIDGPTEDDILRPTLDAAQRWLREVKKAHVICDLSSIGEPPGYSFNVFHFVFDNRGCYKIDENYQCTAYEWYPTYEEALEAGIRKALEIILEK